LLPNDTPADGSAHSTGEKFGSVNVDGSGGTVDSLVPPTRKVKSSKVSTKQSGKRPASLTTARAGKKPRVEKANSEGEGQSASER
jgi:hypothetical protein